MAELLADSGGAIAAPPRLGALAPDSRGSGAVTSVPLTGRSATPPTAPSSGRVAQVRHLLRERLRSLPGR